MAIIGIGGFLSVSAALPAGPGAASYAALTWTDVANAESIPEYGAENATITFTPLKTGVVEKYHGELNYGSMDVTFAVENIPTAGQALLNTANIDKTEIALRETFSSGGVRYFKGKVMSFKDGGASVGSVKMGSARVELTSIVIQAAA